MNNKIIYGVVTILIAGAAFYGGVLYQKSQSPQLSMMTAGFQNREGRGMTMNTNGGSAGNTMRTNVSGVVGEIIAKDDQSITVKLEDGSSKIVLLSSDVTVTKSDTGSSDDLQIGTKVGAFGSTNSDGSVSAANIQINPMMRMGGFNNTTTPSAKLNN